ncbi:MAG: hypothetical protein OH316_02515 [Candidatus Parvarchaeota archaeon]|nr:hypothetical protein [Candidatus Parvarchaeota archaeon]MCW1301983.1 hypothetical protein [Candidatus Parvarchaeota archaeon]
MIEKLLFAVNNTTATSPAPITSTSILYGSIGSFVFPFLLVFAIVYGVLERSEIFKGKRDINSIIALVLAIIFATTNYTLKLTYIILPIIGVLAVVIFMLIMLFSMASTGFGGAGGFKMGNKSKALLGVLTLIIGIILLIWILSPSNLTIQNLTSYLPYIVILVVFGAIIYFISR